MDEAQSVGEAVGVDTHNTGTSFKRRVVAEVGRRAVQRTRSLGVIMSEVIKHSHWVFRWLAERVAPYLH